MGCAEAKPKKPAQTTGTTGAGGKSGTNPYQVNKNPSLPTRPTTVDPVVVKPPSVLPNKPIDPFPKPPVVVPEVVRPEIKPADILPPVTLPPQSISNPFTLPDHKIEPINIPNPVVNLPPIQQFKPAIDVPDANQIANQINQSAGGIYSQIKDQVNFDWASNIQTEDYTDGNFQPIRIPDITVAII